MAADNKMNQHTNIKMTGIFGWTNIVRMWISLLLFVSSHGQRNVLDTEDMCNTTNAIGLPTEGKCLVPYSNAYNWKNAQSFCESKGGTLYQIPDARLNTSPDVLNCISSLPDFSLNDMWLNAVGRWFYHWVWINGTIVNKVKYCSPNIPPQNAARKPTRSNTLSVDFCVSTCHQLSAPYIVLHNVGGVPSCYCKHDIEPQYEIPCGSDVFQSQDRSNFYIVEWNKNSLIAIDSLNSLTATKSLCATVSSDTINNNEIMSDTCFSEHPFLCCLGERDACPVPLMCNGEVCDFHMGQKCMRRMSLAYTWNAARAYCVSQGGDLWNMHDLSDMAQVGQFLDGVSRYWIGATNYFWNFNASSYTLASLGQSSSTSEYRCGHMFLEQIGVNIAPEWNWGETHCDQEKFFMCQYNTARYGNLPALSTTMPTNTTNTTENVVCPWPIIVRPTIGPNPPFVAPRIGDDDDDDGAFPIAALISGLVAGIILLTCLGVAAVMCGHGRWYGASSRNIAFVPYMETSAVDFDATAAGMSFGSEYGSQVGLVQESAGGGALGGGGFISSTYAMSSSYTDQSGMMGGGMSGGGMSGGGMSGGANAQSSSMGRGFGAAGSSSMEDHTTYNTYNTISGGNPGYMTLQAQMNIKDDADVAAMTGSMRRKPEVALVTDSADMLFTVNHAVSHSHAGSEMSRSSHERTMEEITIPVTLPVIDGEFTLNLNERNGEAHNDIYRTIGDARSFSATTDQATMPINYGYGAGGARSIVITSDQETMPISYGHGAGGSRSYTVSSDHVSMPIRYDYDSGEARSFAVTSNQATMPMSYGKMTLTEPDQTNETWIYSTVSNT